jgi:tRNA dimethylallyltransferase
VRRALRQRLASEGLDSLVAELERRDPETARRLAPGDTQRVLRALVVVEVSGEPLAVWIARQPFGEGGLPSIKLALTLPRQILYDLISRRAARMLAQGWIDEVVSLLDRGVRADVPAFQAIGYRQIVRHLGGELTREQAQEEIVRATRRFAKRQLTWFRKERGVIWMDSAGAGHRIDEAMKILARSGIGGA